MRLGKPNKNGDERGKRWCGPCVLTHGHEQLTRKLGALANSLLQGQEAGETRCFSSVYGSAACPPTWWYAWRQRTRSAISLVSAVLASGILHLRHVVLQKKRVCTTHDDTMCDRARAPRRGS